MRKPQITRVSDPHGDWEAYYLDGELIEQTHRVDIWHVMQALSSHIAYADFEGDAEETGGHFPDTLEEVIRVNE